MKKTILFLFLGLSLHLSAKEMSGKITGSGTIKTEERLLNTFTGIQVEGSCEVILTQDNSQKVVIKTDDNIILYLKTEVSGNKLRVFFSDDYSEYVPTSATIYISSSFIEDISLAGSGTIRSTNELKSKNPHYRLTGSGNIKLSVVAESIKTTVSGSGSIDLKGSALTTEHTITGPGNINAMSFTCPDVKVRIAGSGDCSVYAKTSLDVIISGSGNVRYKGTPRLTSSITGSGRVKLLTE